jgi:probable rRNA maturation factor
MHAPGYDIRIVHSGGGRSPRIDAQLRRAIAHTLRRHRCKSADITLTLVSDVEIARLNRRHMRHSGATDVISLDFRDAADAPACGELYISLDTARRVARRLGLSLSAELCLYAVHGTLHLLGYDDRAPADATRMHTKENQLLTQLGLGAVFGNVAAVTPDERTR